MKFKTSLLLFVLLSFFTEAQIPAGYYNAASGLSGAPLKTALYNIIKGHTSVSYDYLWTAFETTDKRANGKVWDMYSSCTFTFGTNQCGNYSAECDCFNREHSWPASWFNDATPMYTDLFHLLPTDGKVNGMRSNYPFGKVGSASYTSGNGSKVGACIYPGYTGTVFEPVDEYKGDFARNYFYMATRYENVISTWHSNDPNAEAILQANSFPVFETWFLNLLGEWSTADPVSQKEIDRNNAVYAIQHNRNPFIDHPEYVYSIWNVGGAPTLTVTPAALNAFSYIAGSGPSVSQTYVLKGSALTPSGGNITVKGTADFKVSLNNTLFDDSVTIAYTLSTLANTTIYVQLKAGLAQGIYSNELVANTGGGATLVNVSCSGSVTTNILPEPTNYTSAFSAQNIELQWTDAPGPILPDGYLVRMSTIGFDAIANPIDGIPYPNSATDQNVPYGVQIVHFINLNSNTTYYFKLFGYNGSGSVIDYKTDGAVPQVQKTTGP